MDEAVGEYLAALAPDRRALLDRVVRLVTEAHPDATVVMAYRMPTFVLGRHRLHVGAWRHGLSFYGWERGRDAGFAARHPELVTSTGTLRLGPAAAAAVGDEELRAFVHAVLEP